MLLEHVNGWADRDIYFEMIDIAHFDYIVSTSTCGDYSNKNIRAINPKFEPIPHCNLNFSFNHIRRIPERFLMNKKFISLDLSENNIKEIPNEWSPWVHYLDLSSNPIKYIPEKFANVHTDHMSLYIQNCGIESFHENWLCNIKDCINELYLNYNSISQIPGSWNPNIAYLILDNNPIEKIPIGWLQDSPCIQFISFTGNIELPNDWEPGIDAIWFPDIPEKIQQEFFDRNPNIEEDNFYHLNF